MPAKKLSLGDRLSMLYQHQNGLAANEIASNFGISADYARRIIKWFEGHDITQLTHAHLMEKRAANVALYMFQHHYSSRHIAEFYAGIGMRKGTATVMKIVRTAAADQGLRLRPVKFETKLHRNYPNVNRAAISNRRKEEARSIAKAFMDWSNHADDGGATDPFALMDYEAILAGKTYSIPSAPFP